MFVGGRLSGFNVFIFFFAKAKVYSIINTALMIPQAAGRKVRSDPVLEGWHLQVFDPLW